MNWELLQINYFGDTLLNWCIALVTFVVVFFGITTSIRYLARKLEAYSKRTQSDLDDLIVDLLKARTKRLFITVFALYGASHVLSLPVKIGNVINAAVFLSVSVQLGIWGNGIINFVVRKRAAEDGEEGLNLEAYSVITWIAKATMWVLVILLALNNLGIRITTLIAGLGISGIAVALAVQNILGDLFASLSIVLDRPFIIGDFIIVGDQMGTVEHVGLKTTRVRSLSGEQLIFSNTDLLSSRIRNFRRMDERRVIFSLGVTYQTPAEKLDRIPGIIREIIESQKQIRFDRAHFSSYGAYSLDFEVVYWVLDRDYNLFRDIHQAINLELFRRFEKEEIEFAYPTQTLFLEKGQGVGQADPVSCNS
jgi:small-conductance mechanosensitive channel